VSDVNVRLPGIDMIALEALDSNNKADQDTSNPHLTCHFIRPAEQEKLKKDICFLRHSATHHDCRLH
jgi:hypothetical protein